MFKQTSEVCKHASNANQTWVLYWRKNPDVLSHVINKEPCSLSLITKMMRLIFAFLPHCLLIANFSACTFNKVSIKKILVQIHATHLSYIQIGNTNVHSGPSFFIQYGNCNTFLKAKKKVRNMCGCLMENLITTRAGELTAVRDSNC